jgi:hypothetical protein
MMKVLRFSVMLTMILILVFVAAPTPTQAKTYGSAEAMIQAYYDAINLRDFFTAFGMWTRPLQTYNQFANGFNDTYLIDTYIGTYQVGTNNPPAGRIPVILAAFRNDGTNASFYGCFSVRYTGNTAQNWVIDGANLKSMGNFYPSVATVSNFLSLNCFGTVSSAGIVVTDRIFSTENWMLSNYYRLVNARDYQTAYAYWLHPLPSPKPNGAPAMDYRQPYQQYVNGYADTVYVNILMGDYIYMGASAGKPYLGGLIPAVLIGQRTDGSFTAYYGCYVIGSQQGLPFSNIGIVSGDFKLLSNGYPSGTLVLQYLNFDCSGLNLKL